MMKRTSRPALHMCKHTLLAQPAHLVGAETFVRSKIWVIGKFQVKIWMISMKRYPGYGETGKAGKDEQSLRIWGFKICTIGEVGEI